MASRVSLVASHLVAHNATAAAPADPFSPSDPYIASLLAHNAAALAQFNERNGTSPISVSFDAKVPHVGIITFNNPAQLNSLSVGMGKAFGRAIDFLNDTARDVRAVVLTGEGRAFCAGADLRRAGTRQKGLDDDKVYEGSEFYNLYLGPIRRCKVPLICSINGHAIGAGFSVALACDMRTAFKDAKVGVNFVRLGLHPGMAATQTLPLLLGTQHAARLLLTGELQPASHPLMSPLFLSTHDTPAASLAAALDVARKAASASPLAVQATTKTLRMRWEANIDQTLEREGWGQMMGRLVEGGAQVAEGTRATAEKREPVFRPVDK
ncbi:ClpP/crotonase [Gonapodya prolifera JEL478]|uniref:ClpP/crotonase n=1 Tax=Gonapodya prolifera (strain JEL478) TaxID=1344416 RepID=A0A139A817_GONPJ|nr:ClpP/crotonase [Gonapodya prolifera JEL478]|eukprot:KXS12942.1 ClpP/crotonase [Gonapodya prolifera JEL478]